MNLYGKAHKNRNMGLGGFSRVLRMHAIGCLIAVFILCANLSQGQSDRGIITGLVSDSSGRALPKAKVQVTNMDTGLVSDIATTSTGVYTAASLPAGRYQVEASAQGFKTFLQTGISVSVAQTAQVNIVLTVGSVEETITVQQDATLLKTENAEQSTTISRKELNELPIPFTQAGAIRDPMAFVKLTPGSYVAPGSTTAIRVNGLPSASFHISVDGMDSTNPNINDREDGNHPSVDNVEEFAVQTSNFAAEYGQVGGGLFNFTARSGTNLFHGSAYDYFTNEDLDAGRPYSQAVANGPIESIRQKKRQNDYGFTVGGPVRIPHLYNGKDKTFFFFNLERFRLDQSNNVTQTVPTEAMRQGDFHEILTGKQLGTDPLGRPIMENTIFDPATVREVNGKPVADPFEGNLIPADRFDAVASKIQNLIPHGAANFVCGPNGNCINNYASVVYNPTRQMIPAFKVDQVITQKWKASFSFSRMDISSFSSNDGLPLPISAIRPNFGTADTYRFNTDYTITPNLLVHFGAGYTRQFQNDGSPAVVDNYDAQANLGLQNTVGLGFPRLGGFSTNFGGIVNGNGNGLGPTQRNQYWSDKANGIASTIWTHGRHVIKGGADYKMDMWLVVASAGSNNVAGNYNFSDNQTSQPSNNNAFYNGGAVGFPYASFLLGLVDSGSIGNANTNQYHRPTYALYLQDTWRATPRLSIDYGMRWDFTETSREHAFRTSGFSLTTPNPAANNLPGALTFEGFGQPGQCNCYFMPHYPYALGPRLGVAFQANPKTVFRGGFGITYGQAASFNYAGSNFSVVSVGINTIQYSKPSLPGLPTYFTPATTLAAGPQYDPAAVTDASRNPAFNCCKSINQAPSPLFDHNGSKPPRIFNFSLSFQREINNSMAIEIAYVGNRAAWLTSGANGAAGLIQPNATSAARLASFGFDVTNLADATTLSSQLGSLPADLQAKYRPYPTFPNSQTLAQALRPFPQYGTIYTEYSPSAKSWYDSLQIKVTKRLSHGLQFLNAFTWSKEQDLGADTGRGNGAIINDALTPASNKFLTSSYQPFVNVTSFTYQLPYVSLGHDSLLTRQLLSGWTLGGIFRYSNGLLLRIPNSGAGGAASLGSTLLRGTFAERVPGVSLFTKSPNCHCFNPLEQNLNTTAGVLNPAAWTEPDLGHFSKTAAYQNDYRWQRQPDEELNLGKLFPIHMGREIPATLQIRAEYFNIFNRTFLPQPSTNGYLTRSNGTSTTTGAFGNINVVNSLSPYAYRTGQLVARFEF